MKHHTSTQCRVESLCGSEHHPTPVKSCQTQVDDLNRAQEVLAFSGKFLTVRQLFKSCTQSPKIVSCTLSGSKQIKYPPCLQKWLPALLAAVPKQLVNDRVYPTKSPSWGGTYHNRHILTHNTIIFYIRV